MNVIKYNVNSGDVCQIGRQYEYGKTQVIFEGYQVINSANEIYFKFVGRTEESKYLIPIVDMTLDITQQLTKHAGQFSCQLEEMNTEGTLVSHSPVFYVAVKRSIKVGADYEVQDPRLETIYQKYNEMYNIISQTNETSLANESQRQAEWLTLKQEVSDAIDSFNADIAIGEFRTLVQTETDNFNTNAETKLTAYNQNDSEKTASYNANATEKLNAYNSNAESKVAEFDTHTEQIQADVSELKSDIADYNCYNLMNDLDKPASVTSNGVTYTRLPDGSYHVEGTAMADSIKCWFWMNSDEYGLPSSIIRGVKYKAIYSATNVELCIWFYEGGTYIIGYSIKADRDFTIPSNCDTMLVRFRVKSGLEVNETVKPVIRRADTYSNEELTRQLTEIAETSHYYGLLANSYLSDFIIDMGDLVSKNYTTLISDYENVGNYESNDVIGYATGYDNDADYALRLYTYRTASANAKNSFGIQPKKILIVSGVHGNEKGSIYNLSKFVEKLVDDNCILNKILRTFDVDVIPCANPYGYYNNVRVNSRGVNLNRNFSYNWSTYEGEVKGTAPLSENESKCISDIISANNYDYVIDWHEADLTNGTYVSTQNADLAKRFINMMRKNYNALYKKYKYFPVNAGQAIAELNTIPSLANEMLALKNINNGLIFEQGWGGDATKWSSNLMRQGLDSFANLMLEYVLEECTV